MEYFLFPKKSYFLTQGYGVNSYSHVYRIALDISAKGGHKEIYAPFTGKIVKKFAEDPMIPYTCWLVSDDKVICADGIMRYAVVMFTHPNGIIDVPIGKRYEQGEYMFDDGTTGGVAPHLDFSISVYENKDDIKVGWYQVPDNSYELYNAKNPTEYMVMDDDVEVISSVYQNKLYTFKRKSNVILEPENEYFVPGGTYRLLYAKYLRKTPEIGDNIVKAKDVDNETKKLLVSLTGNAQLKPCTTITSLIISKEANGRIWGSYGNCWYCMQNIDGKKNSIKV